MDKMIQTTADLAIDKGIIKKRNIGILDSTHSLFVYGSASPREKIIWVSKNLRKKIYKAIDKSGNI